LAKKYHPDTNKNNLAAKRKFQQIRDAYEVGHFVTLVTYAFFDVVP